MPVSKGEFKALMIEECSGEIQVYDFKGNASIIRVIEGEFVEEKL